jgi:hypothetical protein
MYYTVSNIDSYIDNLLLYNPNIVCWSKQDKSMFLVNGYNIMTSYYEYYNDKVFSW